MRLIKSMAVVPLALLSVGVVVLLGVASWGCYKNCDPKVDKNCPCPPDVCGPLAAQDAGAEGGQR